MKQCNSGMSFGDRFRHGIAQTVGQCWVGSGAEVGEEQAKAAAAAPEAHDELQPAAAHLGNERRRASALGEEMDA